MINQINMLIMIILCTHNKLETWFLHVLGNTTVVSVWGRNYIKNGLSLWFNSIANFLHH